MRTIIRKEPIGCNIKEIKSLHLGKSIEVNICSLPLHVHHLIDFFIDSRHHFLLHIRSKNVINRRFLIICQRLQPLIIREGRHNIITELLSIISSIHTEKDLLLDSKQVCHCFFVLFNFIYEFLDIWILF